MTTNINEENWTQIKETILMINVAVARIEHAMVDSNDSFTTLSTSFVKIIEAAEKITLESKNLEDSPGKTKIDENCKDISQRIGSSIIDFQFYDRLSQRVSSVSKTLNALTDILKDPNKIHTQDDWNKLQEMVRSKYTLDADQELLDAILNGASIEEALKTTATDKTEEEIELF